MIPLRLPELLKRALMVGALEVRLVPGRRTVVVTRTGQNEVRGEAQTPEKINTLLDDVLTPEARRGLASGWAEWEFELDGRGPVRATAELKRGAVHAGFLLDGCQQAKPEQVPKDQPKKPKRAPGPSPAARRVGAPIAPKPASAIGVEAHEPSLGTGAGAELATAELASELASAKLAGAGHSSTGADLAGAELGNLEVAIGIPAGTTASNAAVGSNPSVPRNGQPYVAGSSSGSTEAIDALLLRLLDEKGSDLHVSAGAPPMLRRDGDMAPIGGFGAHGAEQVQRMLWPIVPPRNRQEFSERHDTDFAYELVGHARFRVNLFIDLRGMGAVFRVIPSKILTIEDLNLPKELIPLCQLPKGLVLVTGPTGSGKSTTLAALIDYINNTRDAHIITIEDPVEFVHQNKRCLVNQRQVGEHTKSFKAALRAALREDPDIVLLGEMRDLETVAIAMETAETGHLVFGTLHTSSAPSTVDRIIDQFPSNEQNQIRVMLANSLKGVICQMLCKRVGGGRVAALEVMFGVPAISNLIREAKVFQIPSIMQTARNMGMRLMNDNLLSLVKQGLVEPGEALNKATDRATLANLFKQNQIKI